MSLTVESTRFGTLEIEAEAVLSFPRGLIGLGGSRFALLSADADSPFSWLHSVEDAALALPVTRPWHFFPDYEVVLGDEQSAALDLPGDAPADVWVTVRATERLEDFTVNLRAPIIVTPGPDGPQAYQVINEVADAEMRTPLFAAADAGS
jgi:flagellar assembly factor FliW